MHLETLKKLDQSQAVRPSVKEVSQLDQNGIPSCPSAGAIRETS